jgi:adenine-specific DNA methylase
MRKQFKGKYSKLAQVSRNSLVFVEHFQTAINREIEAAKRGEKIHTIEDTARLVTVIQKLQRLSEEANSTLNNLEDSLMSFIE